MSEGGLEDTQGSMQEVRHVSFEARRPKTKKDCKHIVILKFAFQRSAGGGGGGGDDESLES